MLVLSTLLAGWIQCLNEDELDTAQLCPNTHACMRYFDSPTQKEVQSCAVSTALDCKHNCKRPCVAVSKSASPIKVTTKSTTGAVYAPISYDYWYCPTDQQRKERKHVPRALMTTVCETKVTIDGVKGKFKHTCPYEVGCSQMQTAFLNSPIVQSFKLGALAKSVLETKLDDDEGAARNASVALEIDATMLTTKFCPMAHTAAECNTFCNVECKLADKFGTMTSFLQLENKQNQTTQNAPMYYCPKDSIKYPAESQGVGVGVGMLGIGLAIIIFTFLACCTGEFICAKVSGKRRE